MRSLDGWNTPHCKKKEGGGERESEREIKTDGKEEVYLSRL
jgi:hypothetical protein